MNRLSIFTVALTILMAGWAGNCPGLELLESQTAALCHGGTPREQSRGALPVINGPVHVEIGRRDTAFHLYRDGEPYFIKGIGGRRFLESAAAAGANSVRTWGAADAGALLERAHSANMTVMLGIWLSHHPEDYNDPSYRDQKTAEIRRLVERHKDHPALLIWALGNEINLQGADTPAAWTFVNGLAGMIKQLDAHHPVISIIACNSTTLNNISTFAPTLDAVGINAYGALARLRAMIDRSSYTGPYLITEWGVTGHWEAQLTGWGRPIEPTSTWKADFQIKRYRLDILANGDRCLGSYVFLWGQKQERTPTWYSMILENLPGMDSSRLACPMVDAMHYNWTGSWPVNRAPDVWRMLINGISAEDNIILSPGEAMISEVQARDPENEPLTYVWELLEEPSVLSIGGSHEDRPISLASVRRDTSPSLSLRAPLVSGQYRLFVYVLDSSHHVATANIPFEVREPPVQEAKAGPNRPGA